MTGTHRAVGDQARLLRTVLPHLVSMPLLHAHVLSRLVLHFRRRGVLLRVHLPRRGFFNALRVIELTKIGNSKLRG